MTPQKVRRKQVTKEYLKQYGDDTTALNIECFITIFEDGSADITHFNIYTPDGLIRLKDSFRLPLSKLEWGKSRVE